MLTITIGRPGPRGHDRLQLAAAQDRVGRVGGRDHDVRGRAAPRRGRRSPRPGRRSARPARGRCRRCGSRRRSRCTPCCISDRVVASAIRPAPITSTRRSGRSAKTSSARSRATAGTDDEPVPMWVRERTLLPTSSAWRKRRLRMGPVAPSSVARSHAAQHLPLDLALADDHRVEARGDPEELGGGAVVAQDVARAGELVGRDAGVGDDRLGHRVLGERPGPGRPRRSRCGCR